MDTKKKRTKKVAAAAVPITESVVSAFGGSAPSPQGPTSAIFIEEVEEAVTPTPKSKKPAKRKPAIVASVTPEGIQGSLLTEQRPLIAHLPIHANEIDNDLFASTSSPASSATGGQPTP